MTMTNTTFVKTSEIVNNNLFWRSWQFLTNSETQIMTFMKVTWETESDSAIPYIIFIMWLPKWGGNFDPNLFRTLYLSSSEQIHHAHIQQKHTTVKPILVSPERLSTPPFGLWLCPVLESGRAGKLSFIYQKVERGLKIKSSFEVMLTLTTRRITRARKRARPEM